MAKQKGGREEGRKGGREGGRKVLFWFLGQI